MQVNPPHMPQAKRQRIQTGSGGGRKFFVGGNWKMHGTSASIRELIQAWRETPVTANVEVVIGCPAPYLSAVSAELAAMKFGTAAQNCYKADKGAFTGEISPGMIKDSGADWVILGHSERRDVFGETDAQIADKTKFAIDHGLKVIWCCGEHKEERESGATDAVIAAQLEALAAKLAADDWGNLVIAYEPVWAIGTGLTATPEMAQHTQAQIRGWLRANASDAVAAQTRILYGGSVKPANCDALAAQPDIDGFLVGGASLKPDFTSVMNAADKSGC